MEHEEFVKAIDDQSKLIAMQKDALNTSDKIIHLQNQLIELIDKRSNNVVLKALLITLIIVITIDIIIIVV